MDKAENCPHKDNIIYGSLRLYENEPEYLVSCGDCGERGVIFLVEIGEAWGEDVFLSREVNINKSLEKIKR